MTISLSSTFSRNLHSHSASSSDDDLSEALLTPQRAPSSWNAAEETAESYVPKELSSPLYFAAPENLDELEQRLNSIMGRSIAELAALAQVPLPYHNSMAKGFAGQLIEIFLGAHARNLPVPDFEKLRIELKTLPLNADLKPQESTFLCSANLGNDRFVPFNQSALYHKVKQILFVLLFAPSGAPMGIRHILGYFYFRPDAATLNLIETDYNEFFELVTSGRTNEIDGACGNIIQMRPKAATSKDVVPYRDATGHIRYTIPRGFYLRTEFTRNLVAAFLQEQQVTASQLAALKQLTQAPF